MVSPITMFTEGGAFMWIILVVFVFAMAIAFERLFFVVFRANINATAFMAQIQKLIMANNIDRAIKLCNAEPHAMLPKVVKAGLTRANRTEKELENAIQEVTLEIAPIVNKRTAYLGMLANVATLVGLLGTIMGLIQAFTAVANANPAEKADLLSASISVAMNTTAFGLMVAIPLLIIHAILTSKTGDIVDSLEMATVKALNVFSRRAKRMAEAAVAS